MSIDFNESKILRIPEFNDDEGIELSDFPDIYFGDFFDEFFKKKIVVKGKRRFPIIDLNKSSKSFSDIITKLLPDDWMKDLDGTTPYFTHLRRPQKYNDYKIGNNAIKQFLKSPDETKRKLTAKIKKFIYSPSVTFDEGGFRCYILNIINLKFPDEIYTKIKNMYIKCGDSEENPEENAKKIKTRYEKRLIKFIGEDENEISKIINAVSKLFDLSMYAEVFALFVLAFIVLQKLDIEFDKQTIKDILPLIWFDSENIKETIDNSSHVLSEFLTTYELPSHIERFSLEGESFKQECYVINGKRETMRSYDKHAYGCKTVSLSDYKELGAVISTAKEGYKVKFLLFEKDNNGNLEDCLNLLDMLYKCRFSNIYEQRMVSENIDIYVCADFDFASTLIDSAINRSDDVYYRVHICDYNKMAAQKLLSEAPLFIPSLIDGSDVNLVIIGINEATFKLTEEVIASTFIPNIPKISLIGNNADFYKRKLQQKLPGVYKTEPRVKRIIPEFYECDIESADFLELLTNNASNEYELSLSGALIRGTYFIVDLGDDRDNMLFARNLRAWLLGCDKNFSRTPFIAVKCKDGRNANIARHLVVNNKKSGKDYFNNYNLYFYGMKDTMFNFDYLDIENNRQKQMALNIHLSYYGDNLNEKEKADAIASYFRFSYNRDSSECASVSIAYMLYSLGIIKTLDDLKCDENQLAKKYEEWMQERDNRDAAARYEHSRWVGFMLSRGWRSASLGQVRAYAGQESGKDHKHTLCRLHPFICNWDDFNDEEENMKISALKAVNEHLQLPTTSTYNIVSAIGKILTNNPFAYKELEIDESR